MICIDKQSFKNIYTNYSERIYLRIKQKHFLFKTHCHINTTEMGSLSTQSGTKK